MQESKWSGYAQKTNFRQFFLQFWKLQDSDFNGTGLHQGDLMVSFKKNSLAKVNFLKLLTNKGKPLPMFSLAHNLLKIGAYSKNFQKSYLAENYGYCNQVKSNQCWKSSEPFSLLTNRNFFKKIY